MNQYLKNLLGEEPMAEETMSEELPEEVSDGGTEDRDKNTWLRVLALILAISLIALVAYLIFGLRGSDEDDSWSRVEESGILRAGTSADYPPFSYFNNQNEIDGFDAALIKEIGSKLGIRVELTDFAFDGLGGALQVDQIDVAIAALSVTPEREAVVSFSNVYYVGEDGVLAQEGSNIGPITSASDLAGHRVGVQRRSVYEDWARVNLVETGLITERMLYVYEKPEHAVEDLRRDRLDLVMMDLEPATVAHNAGGVQLAGKGLNQQTFAIAIPLGAEEFRLKINEALTALQNEEKLAQLYSEYLGLTPEEIPPTPTPEPTASPTPEETPTEPTATPTEAPCVDSTEFIEDLSYDDDDMTDLPELDPGEEFTKGWRIKNSGTCTWDESYTLQYVRGSTPESDMDGQPTSVDWEVRPGETYDMYVDLVAPEVVGDHIGFWQMHNGDDVPFGETIWVAIEVVTDEPTPTDTPVVPSDTLEEPEPTATEAPEPTATEEPEPTATATEIPGSDLLYQTWTLVGILDASTETLVEPIEKTEPNIEFIFENDAGRVQGNAGCNMYNGDYMTDGEHLTISGITSTRTECTQPEGIMEQEAWFLELLEAVEEYQILGESLEMLVIEEVEGEQVETVILVYEETME